MTRWRYTLKLVSLEGEEVVRVQSSLNSLGETGWEAVAWIPDPQTPSRGWVLMKMPSATS